MSTFSEIMSVRAETKSFPIRGIIRPIIIIGAPRSGTTLLFSILSSHPELWSLYEESEEKVLRHYVHPMESNWSRGNSLNESDATPHIVEGIRNSFRKKVVNYQVIFRDSLTKVYTGSTLKMKLYAECSRAVLRPFKVGNIRIVEKTPKNCLRVPFLDRVFPDAYFIFLVRNPYSNISSLIEGWRSNDKYLTYDVPSGLAIEGYEGERWNFLLPPRWKKYAKGKRLEEVCSFQYVSSNTCALESLKRLPQRRWLKVRYEDLVDSPEKKMREICKWAELDYNGGLRRFAETMPTVNSLSSPDRDKWKKNEKLLLSVSHMFKRVAAELGYGK